MKKYILVIILALCTLALFDKHNDKPTIRIALYNFWDQPKLKNIPLRQWPHEIINKIHFFFYPEDTLKTFALSMLQEILSERYNIVLDNTNYDILIDTVFDNKPLPDNNAVKIFFTGEAITVRNPDNYDLALGFDYIDHPHYIRLPLYYTYHVYNNHDISTNFNHGTCNVHKPYFACFLYSNSGEDNPTRWNGAIERTKLFDTLSKYKEVKSGGKYKNNIGHIVATHETIEWMSQCKFVISYENQIYDGYMTEKPFIAYFAGAVPLYYGDKHAMQDINDKAVIFQGDFSSQDKMVEYIKQVDNDDELYCKIWDQQIIIDPSKTYEAMKNKVREKLNNALKNKGIL